MAAVMQIILRIVFVGPSVNVLQRLLQLLVGFKTEATLRQELMYATITVGFHAHIQ